jgi:hypothetical protein
VKADSAGAQHPISFYHSRLHEALVTRTANLLNYM